MSLVVGRATVEEIRPLRHAVLRPGRPPSAVVWERDDESIHLAAWDGDDVVGCATVTPETDGWRLRGMAVAPVRQRGGVGRAVLGAAIEAVREAGGSQIHANARTTALPFYEAMGFSVVGEEFMTPATGLPHKRIVRLLESSRGP